MQPPNRNRELVLKGEHAREYAEWFSIWCHLRQASQALHFRTGIERTNMFARRALWDGAVIAHSRCFKSGVRRALLRQLLDDLSPPQRERHAETIRWRDRHIAHRVDRRLEKAGGHRHRGLGWWSDQDRGKGSSFRHIRASK